MQNKHSTHSLYIIRFLGIILLGIIFIALSIITPRTVYAHALELCRWDPSTPYAGYNLSGVRSAWRGEIIEAASKWNDASSGWNFYIDFYSANEFVERNLGYAYGEGSTITDQETYSPYYLFEADTRINTYYTFNIDSDVDIQTVALHEFGHWLSLDDTTGWLDNRYEVMYYTYNAIKQTLLTGDIAGIQSIYGE